MTDKKKVLLVDDHLLFLECAKAYLLSTMKNVEFEICNSLDTADEQLQNAPHLFHLVIIDFHMPGSQGADTIKQFVQKFPHTRFAVISGRVTRHNVTDCISSGIAGFILKDISTEELKNAIQTILNGGIYLPNSVLSEPNVNHTQSSSAVRLTRREIEVLTLVHDGLSNKGISRELDVTEVTVKMHLKNLLRKYKVKNRTELVVNSSEDITIKNN